MKNVALALAFLGGATLGCMPANGAPPGTAGTLRNIPARSGKPAQDAGLGVATTETAQYTFITIDAPQTNYTAAYGVNDLGVVTGFYTDSAGNYHGFVWRHGKLDTVDGPDSVDTLLGDANNANVVVGNWGDFTTQHAALHPIGTTEWITLPDIEGKPFNLGDGINDLGLAVGAAGEGNLNSASSFVGWIWDGYKYSFFTVPGASGTYGTQPNGINDRGQIVGLFDDASGDTHGFLKEDDKFTVFDFPGAVNTNPFGINNRGEIAGNYTTATAGHGFIEVKGNFITLDVPGAAQTIIYGLNDAGDLAGNWFDTDGNGHGFVAFRKGRPCGRCN